MVLSNAVILANIASGDALTVNSENNRVGINSTTPRVTLDVAGIVSATAFYGDGSNLEGVASAGLGTAINSDVPGLDVIYFTDEKLGIADTITVGVPTGANVAYTQYQEIVVNSGADFIVEDGDDFIPDILGIGSDVQSPGPLAGGGGRIRADNFTDKSGSGAPSFPSGIIVTGIVTATTLDQNVTGDISATGSISAGSSVTAAEYYGDGSGLTNVGLAQSTTTLLVWLVGGG